MLKKRFIDLLWQVGALAIFIALIIGGAYVYAAFVEPSAAPSSSNQDFAQNVLGADNSNNSFASTNVVANADGSIIERLEYIGPKANNIGTGNDAANMATTLFAGQQYLWDNRASFGAGSSAPSGWTCTLRTTLAATAATASCTGNEKVISGGCYYSYSVGPLRANRPTDQGWYCRSGSTDDVTAYANCCL